MLKTNLCCIASRSKIFIGLYSRNFLLDISCFKINELIGNFNSVCLSLFTAGVKNLFPFLF